MKRSKYQGGQAQSQGSTVRPYCDSPDPSPPSCFCVNKFLNKTCKFKCIYLDQREATKSSARTICQWDSHNFLGTRLISSGLGPEIPNPESQTQRPKCQKPVELNKYFDSETGERTGGATAAQIVINMPEIGIQKKEICSGKRVTESGRYSQLVSTRRGEGGAIYVKIVVLKTWEIAEKGLLYYPVRAGGGQGVWARKIIRCSPPLPIMSYRKGSCLQFVLRNKLKSYL